MLKQWDNYEATKKQFEEELQNFNKQQIMNKMKKALEKEAEDNQEEQQNEPKTFEESGHPVIDKINHQKSMRLGAYFSRNTEI